MKTKSIHADVPISTWKSFRKECIESEFTIMKAIRMGIEWFIGASHEERIAMYRKYAARGKS